MPLSKKLILKNSSVSKKYFKNEGLKVLPLWKNKLNKKKYQKIKRIKTKTLMYFVEKK
jgi:hypothetical protein